MTITSIGYDRAISYAELGILQMYAGCEYSVFAADAFAVSAGPGDREVRVQPGRAYGKAILDDSDEVESLTAAPVSSGSRWDLVAMRRTWSNVEGESESQLIIIQGTSARQIPAARQGEGGVLDDQPLALVRFTAGQTAAQEFVDLRAWAGSGGVSAKDPMVREYLARIGTHLWIAGTRWTLGFNTSGIPTWFEANAAIAWSAVTGKPATFPPSSHIHDVGDIQQDGRSFIFGYLPETYYSKTQVNTLLAAKLTKSLADYNADLATKLTKTTAAYNADLNYRDALIGDRVAKSGDTMSGHLYLPASSAASVSYTVAYINGDGRVSRGASSIRFKDDIVVVDPLLMGDLETQLHSFVMKDDPGRMTRYGNLAELLDAVPALQPFVVYERVVEYEQVETLDSFGNVVGTRDVAVGSHLLRDDDGKPVPLSIDFIALQTAQIAQLYARQRLAETALEELAGRVAALEGSR